MNKIILCDGSELDLFDADSIRERVTLESIAVGLSNKCRYGGQCKQFYSVAMHSYFLTKHFERIGKPELIPIALMHDCVEAFLPDITAPIKPYFGIKREADVFVELNHIEFIIQSVIFAKFGLDINLLDNIADADIAIRETEMHYLFGTPAPAELMFDKQALHDSGFARYFLYFLGDLKKYVTPNQA